QVLWQRRPDLAAWAPNPADCDQLARNFQGRAAEIERTRRAAEGEEQRAQAALQQADKELQTSRDRLTSARAIAQAALQGRLHGGEGLHLKRAEAAAALTETEQALDQEKLEADAHKHLRELFEGCRERTVHRVLGPISDRVLQWARHLGLDEYQQVQFRDG